MRADGTYESADELLTAVYETFGSRVAVKQWGDFFDTEIVRVEDEPVTIVVEQTRYDHVQEEMF